MEGFKFGEAPKSKPSFSNILNSLSGFSMEQKKKAMKVGDYLDIPYETFLSWEENNKKDKKDKNKQKDFSGRHPKIIRVSIVEINDNGDRISVQSGNVIKKDLDSNLFLNYGSIQ